MDDEIPETTRAAVMRRCHAHCEHCGRRAPLELHHHRYHDDEGNSIRGREEPEDLAALCRECHERSHVDPNGDWWNDPQEKSSWWETPDNANDMGD